VTYWLRGGRGEVLPRIFGRDVPSGSPKPDVIDLRFFIPILNLLSQLRVNCKLSYRMIFLLA